MTNGDDSKKILIINSVNESGKEAFINQLNEVIPTYYYSIVEPVKFIASYVGWDGDKLERDKEFISNLKILVDNYSDYNYQSVLQIIKDFRLDRINTNILCIDIREQKDIDRLKKEHDITTVLVACDDVSAYTTEYDYVIKSKGSIEEIHSVCEQFVKDLYYQKIGKV